MSGYWLTWGQRLNRLAAIVMVLLLVGPVSLADMGKIEPPSSIYMPVVVVSTIAKTSPLKGIGTVTRDTVNQDVAGVGAGWWHNWIYSPWTATAPGFVPTIWGASFVGQPVTTASGPLLTFNEPNGPTTEGGCDLSPEAAAALWPQLMAAYPAHSLVAPTVRTQTHPAYPDWRQWLDRWWAALAPDGRARVTSVSLNCYADTVTCAGLVTAVRSWVQPTGGHDAYPLGARVLHGGYTWQSLIAANVWEPGSVGAESLWENLTPPPPTADWAVGVAYKVGDHVMYLGLEYVCLQAHTSISTWNPVATLDVLWRRV